MSAEALTWAFRQAGHNFLGEAHAMKPAERFVLVCLADRANQEGVAWPGYADIAYRTGYSKRRVITLLARLVSAGLVEKIERSGTRGRQTSNLYGLHFERGVPMAEVGRRIDRVARYNATLPREPVIAGELDGPVDNSAESVDKSVDNSESQTQDFHPPLMTADEV